MTLLNCVAIADDDSLISKLEPTCDVDVLICLGDLYDRTISGAVDHYAPEYAIGIRGNHCLSDEFPAPIVDLHLKVVTINGITFGGFCGSWQYKKKGNFMFEQDEVKRLMIDFPAVDVFIAHNSPRFIHERDDNVHQGFDAFIDYIDRTKPSYFFHGHQHCNQITHRGVTKIVGVYGERQFQIHHPKSIS